MSVLKTGVKNEDAWQLQSLVYACYHGVDCSCDSSVGVKTDVDVNVLVHVNMNVSVIVVAMLVVIAATSNLLVYCGLMFLHWMFVQDAVMKRID